MTGKTATAFDFDAPVDRRNTASLKWDRYKDRDIIPLWVADMDFKAPPAVVEALHRHVDHGIYGYTLAPGPLMAAVLEMLEAVHSWRVDPSWIVWLPGLVTGINIACRATGLPGDSVLTTTPAYPPFLSAPALSQRNLRTSTHKDDGTKYLFDFQGVEQMMEPRTRLFLLCNPQNPTGRVFTENELSKLAEICLSNRVIICSDEIHCGLILDDGKPHITIAALHEDIAKQSITLLSPSKTYNLPGLGFSFAVIPDAGLRKSFRQAMTGIVPHVNAFGYTAAQAAYRHCEDWRSALTIYLRGNRDMVEDFVSDSRHLSMHHVEATYLAWIDCRQLGVKDLSAFFDDAGVGLSNGIDFGAPGFMRLNFGCRRSVLAEALARMRKAIGSLEGF